MPNAPIERSGFSLARARETSVCSHLRAARAGGAQTFHWVNVVVPPFWLHFRYRPTTRSHYRHSGGGSERDGEGWTTTGSDCRSRRNEIAGVRERERTTCDEKEERCGERSQEGPDRHTRIIYSAFIRDRAPRRASDEYQAASSLLRRSLDHRSLDP